MAASYSPPSQMLVNPQTVRPARANDAHKIAAVHIETWQHAYRGQLPDLYLDQLGQQLEPRAQFWRSEISNPRSQQHEIWVAGDATTVDGFVAFGPEREAADPDGEVYALYVHPTVWNKGMGRALIARAEERLNAIGFRAAILWVLESNTHARRFYALARWATDGGLKSETLPGDLAIREVRYRKLLVSRKEGK